MLRLASPWRLPAGQQQKSMVLITHAFGPSALRDGASILQAAESLIQQQAGSQVIVVTGAPAEATAMLEDSIRLGSYPRVYNRLLSLYQSLARTLIREERDRRLLIQDITDMLDSYRWLGRSLATREPTPAEAAGIAALGERLTARLLTSHLQHRGVQASAVRASELIVTDDSFLAASADLSATRARVNARLLARLADGYLPVVDGGSGGTPDGRLTRLALGGTAHSGALLAAAADADALWLWSGGPGLMTANPDLLPEARPVAALTPAELDILAWFDAAVPPAAALRPALERSIPVRLRGLAQSDLPGTDVRPTPDLPPGALRCVAASDRVRLIAVNGPGAAAERGFSVLAQQGFRALALTEGLQTTFVVGSRDVNLARLALGDAFGPNVSCVTQDDTGAAAVLALGPDICQQPAAAEQIRLMLSAAGVRAERLAPVQVGSRAACGLLALVPADARAAALAALHPLCAPPR